MFVATADEAGDSVIPVEPVVEDEKSVPIAHPIVATTPDAEKAFFERLSQSQDPSSNPDETSENPVLESEPLTQTDERIMTRKSARRKSRQAESNLTEPEQDVEEVNSARSRERLLIAVIMGSGLVLLCGLAGIGYIAYTLLGVKNKNIESVLPVDVPAPGATNPENLPPSINSYDTALAKVKASVVTVRATSADVQLTGSGFFVPGPGLVLTSARIVGQSKTPKVFSRIQVILGDEGAAQTLLATLIGADPELDLALLQVTSLSIPDPAPFDNLGSVKRGQQVFAFADPGTGNKRGVSVIIGSVTDLNQQSPHGSSLLELMVGLREDRSQMNKAK